MQMLLRGKKKKKLLFFNQPWKAQIYLVATKTSYLEEKQLYKTPIMMSRSTRVRDCENTGEFGYEMNSVAYYLFILVLVKIVSSSVAGP